MSRAALLAAALCCGACERQAASPEVRSGLRVPLPDGWRAAAVANGLAVGPSGRVVLQLENTSRPFPDAQAFVAAIEAEGAKVLNKESLDSFIGVSYSIGERQAFLGVHGAGPSTIWCSSAPGAKADEVEAALTVCRGLSWEPDAAK